MGETIFNPDGGPAFPGGYEECLDGMSLRDWFAGQALTTVSHIATTAAAADHAIAARCYDVADAMLMEKRHRERVDRNGPVEAADA